MHKISRTNITLKKKKKWKNGKVINILPDDIFLSDI